VVEPAGREGHLTQETRVQSAYGDVVSTIHQSLAYGAHCGLGLEPGGQEHAQRAHQSGRGILGVFRGVLKVYQGCIRGTSGVY